MLYSDEGFYNEVEKYKEEHKLEFLKRDIKFLDFVKFLIIMFTPLLTSHLHLVLMYMFVMVIFSFFTEMTLKKIENIKNDIPADEHQYSNLLKFKNTKWIIIIYSISSLFMYYNGISAFH